MEVVIRRAEHWSRWHGGRPVGVGLFAQAFVERAIGGSTHDAFVAGQENRWFVEGMVTRLVFGLMFAAGYVVLVWDLLTIGRRVPALAAAEVAE